jgi:predicted nuclease of predicted toxin-antitoxin system
LRLLVDEMYDPEIASRLRDLDHDAVHLSDRSDLKGASDDTVFSVAQNEQRVIFTNNVRDFVSIINLAIQGGSAFHGIVFSNDRSVARAKSNTGTISALLHGFMAQHAEDETLPAGVHWLP